MRARRVMLDAATASGDENMRLRPLPPLTVTAGAAELSINLEPYGIEYWYLEETKR